MHFDAERYPAHTSRRSIAKEYAATFPNLFVTFDEMVITI